MKENGIVKWLLIAMLVVCVVQLMYYLPSMRVERDANDYAKTKSTGITDENLAYQAEKQARIEYLDSMSDRTIFSIFESFTRHTDTVNPGF